MSVVTSSNVLYESDSKRMSYVSSALNKSAFSCENKETLKPGRKIKYFSISKRVQKTTQNKYFLVTLQRKFFLITGCR